MGYKLPRMTEDVREQARRRLRRVAGQVAALERMIDEDRYCVDVLVQVAAARAALDGVGKVLLQGHVEHCFAEAMASGRAKERGQKIAELLDVFARFASVGGR
jgi:DNA-binding FrmR family transcriptional regulator